MSTTAAVWLLIILALIAANLPWLNERVFFFMRPSAGKRAWVRFAEWLVLYFVVGGIAMGLEYKLNGNIYHQTWEFYAVTFCIFLVFALPSFVYRYDLRRHLRQE